MVTLNTIFIVALWDFHLGIVLRNSFHTMSSSKLFGTREATVETLVDVGKVLFFLAN